MIFWESLTMAVRTLAANRTRSLLTMLGILIGNASTIAVVGIGEGAKRYATDQFQSLGTNVLFVIAGSDNTRRNIITPPNRLVLADAEAIAQQVPTVTLVAPEVRGSELVVLGNQRERGQIIGTTPEYSPVREVNVALGRFLSTDDLRRNARVTVLGCGIATKLLGVSSRGNDCDMTAIAAADPLSKRIRIRGIGFDVIGIMEEKGASLGTNQDDTIFLPQATMTGLLVGRTSPYGIAVPVINVSAKDADSVAAAQFQIENLLRLRHGITENGDDTFVIRSQKDALSIAGNVTNALTIMLAAIAGISLVVGGIGITNIMLVSVVERTQEIGLRKALGATQSDILLQFAIEAVILATLGGVLGTALGVGGVTLVGWYTPLKAGVSGGAIAMAVGVSGSIGLFFGIFPARQAARLDPIVALRTP
ncbi:MAG TPA: ABC transporter permease [Cyanobacteria bacterium UBA8156]|nr:ABC transporter permease [Cyanobacteria bacterium UBA8156]